MPKFHEPVSKIEQVKSLILKPSHRFVVRRQPQLLVFRKIKQWPEIDPWATKYHGHVEASKKISEHEEP